MHQDVAIFNMLSVAENLAIGRGFPVNPLTKAIRWRALRRHARTVLDRFAIDVDPWRLAGELRPSGRTMVAIARALQDQSDASEGILILDEPTVSLPAVEVDLLFDALKRYASAGQTILFVTHRLDEVSRIADRVTVLRDGRLAATLEGAQITNERLVELIVGRALDHEAKPSLTLGGEDLVLEVADLWGGPMRGVSFGLRQRGGARHRRAGRLGAHLDLDRRCSGSTDLRMARSRSTERRCRSPASTRRWTPDWASFPRTAVSRPS